MKRTLIFFLLLANTFLSFAQTPSNKYPKGYFRNPMDFPLEIAANFGELRSNHWHMGLDIRTKQKENQLVHASAEGYIAFVGIRPQSFGRFIIINHPNGYSTLYAHLNDFYPELEQYVTEQQYQQESWAVELTIPVNKFKVSKGQFIAYSGNTGGSQGPHVHFEIFDTKTTRRFNPLLFGFELKDNVPPTLVRLAMYDRSKSLYDQSPVFFPVKYTDSGYILPKIPVIKTGLSKVSFAIQANDKVSGSTNPNGIFSAKLYADDEPQVGFVLDNIDYNETAYLNAQIDYKHKYNGGVYVQHVSKMPGDLSNIYTVIKNDGVLHLADTTIRKISIEVKDANFNTSVLNFYIQHSDSLPADERSAVPFFAATQVNIVEKPDFEAYLPEGCVYDSIPLTYARTNSSAAYAVSGVHSLNNGLIPLHDDMSVRIKPDRTVPAEWKDKLVMQRSGRGTSLRKAEWQSGWLAAKFGDFGNFQVFADVVPPTVNSLGKGDTINLSAAKRIVFTPSDNFAVSSFRAELNGQWLRFTNDKSRNWIYIFDERCPYGVHELKVTVTDLVGNSSTQSWWFRRAPYTPPPPRKKAVKKTSTKKKTAAPVKRTTTKKKQ